MRSFQNLYQKGTFETLQKPCWFQTAFVEEMQKKIPGKPRNAFWEETNEKIGERFLVFTLEHVFESVQLEQRMWDSFAWGLQQVNNCMRRQS